MTAASQSEAKPSKGERTTSRILDAAEAVFAERGFDAASLREIARRAGIQQPGLYNHFASKRDLYAAVLDRALVPMADAMTECLADEAPRKAITRLPGVMTDHLLAHPQMAALFQQALQGEASPGQEMMHDWLARLMAQGVDTSRSATRRPVDRQALAIEMLAMFNVTTGYFLAQRALDALDVGDLADPANVARQKAVLDRIARAIARR